MRKEVKLTLAQISCKVGDKESNIRKMEEIIKQAKEKGSNLIIFPELALTGYLCKDLVYELAESIPNGPSISHIIETAKRQNVHVIFGMIECSAKAAAVLHNTAVLVGPKGLIGKYQKSISQHTAFSRRNAISAKDIKPPFLRLILGKLD